MTIDFSSPDPCGYRGSFGVINALTIYVPGTTIESLVQSAISLPEVSLTTYLVFSASRSLPVSPATALAVRSREIVSSLLAGICGVVGVQEIIVVFWPGVTGVGAAGVGVDGVGDVGVVITLLGVVEVPEPTTQIVGEVITVPLKLSGQIDLAEELF
jgi:hypothetical protein